jgi:hypothetical protein
MRCALNGKDFSNWKIMCPSNDVESIPPFVIKATAAASLGGLIFGYDIGVISIALPQLAEEFNLEEKQQEMIVSFLYIGCSMGATNDFGY